jgi:hypothetical protein
MTFEQACKSMDRDERFRAAVYAMNTLLTDKGVYTAAEFEKLFLEHAVNVRTCNRIERELGWVGKRKAQQEKPR